MTDAERAIADQWKRYADACTEHRIAEGLHACHELSRLLTLLIPEQDDAHQDVQ